MSVYAINPESTALLLIDAQHEYFSELGNLHTPHAAGIEKNLIELRETARKSGVRTVHVQHVHRSSGVDVGRMGDFDETEVFTEGSAGAEIISSLSPDDEEIVVKKNRYSAFVNTELESILRGNRIDTVIVCGLMTQYCSVTTARHAHDLDYKVIFVSDANAGPDLPDVGFGEITHEDALRVVATMLAVGIADVQTTEEVVAGMKGG